MVSQNNMAKPEIYRNKLSELDINRWNPQPTTVQGAQKTIAKIEEIETFLRALGKQLELEIDQVEARYNKALKVSSLTGSSLWFGDKQTIAEKKKLKHEFDQKREQLLTDYAEVKTQIKQMFKLYAAKKQHFLEFIEQELGQKPKSITATLGGLIKKTLPTERNKASDYQEYLRSSEWRKKAEAAKIRAGNRCQGCNRPRTEVQLEAHHRTYERIGCELPGDITVLCRTCHQSIEESKAKISLEKNLKKPNHGLCICCGCEIPLNQHRPLCPNCYKNWRKGNNEYATTARFCHVCGKEHQTSLAKPLCLDCYKDIKILNIR